MIHHTYSQSTGRWWNEKGELLSVGYSGAGEGKNNPKAQSTQNVGPIPRGIYIIGAPYDSKNVGSFALPLVPSQHSALGRTNFLIHGDSLKAPGTASKGCIILPRTIRELIHNQNCRLLLVIE
jgi:hypothetical protein